METCESCGTPERVLNCDAFAGPKSYASSEVVEVSESFKLFELCELFELFVLAGCCRPYACYADRTAPSLSANSLSGISGHAASRAAVQLPDYRAAHASAAAPEPIIVQRRAYAAVSGFRVGGSMCGLFLLNL